MALTITARELIQSLPALASIGGQSIQGNPRLAYNLGKLWKNAVAEGQTLRDQEIAIYKDAGGVEQDGAWMVYGADLDEAARAAFNEALQEFNAIAIELWGAQVPFADIEKAGLALTANEFNTLDWLITAPE